MKDEERAVKVASLAHEGNKLHGRGFVYVRTRVTTKYSRAAVSNKAKVSRHMTELVQPEIALASGAGKLAAASHT